MKKLFIIVSLAILVMATFVNAAPFLRCDYVDDADSYLVSINGEPEIETQAQLNYDLEYLDPGEYTVIVKAKKGVWVGEPSDPFSFTKPKLSKPVLSIE